MARMVSILFTLSSCREALSTSTSPDIDSSCWGRTTSVGRDEMETRRDEVQWYDIQKRRNKCLSIRYKDNDDMQLVSPGC